MAACCPEEFFDGEKLVLDEELRLGAQRADEHPRIGGRDHRVGFIRHRAAVPVADTALEDLTRRIEGLRLHRLAEIDAARLEEALLADETRSERQIETE